MTAFTPPLTPPFIFSTQAEYIRAQYATISDYCTVQLKRTMKQLQRDGVDLNKLAQFWGITPGQVVKKLQFIDAKMWIEKYGPEFRRQHGPRV